MIFGIRVRPGAEKDVDDLALFIAKNSHAQAMRFYDAINSTYEMILEAPGRWAVYGFTNSRLKDICKRSVLEFPKHLVFYRIDADMVEIVRVLHGARDLAAVFAEMMEGEAATGSE